MTLFSRVIAAVRGRDFETELANRDVRIAELEAKNRRYVEANVRLMFAEIDQAQLIETLRERLGQIDAIQGRFAQRALEAERELADARDTIEKRDGYIEALTSEIEWLRHEREHNACAPEPASAQQRLAGVGDFPAPAEPDLDDRVVYDGVTEHVFQIVRLSFLESNKWFLSQGKDALEISARILDKAFLARVHQRDVVFGEGDCVKVRLHTVSRQRGTESFRSSYEVLEVIEFIAAPLQMDLPEPQPEPSAAAHAM